MLRRNFAAHSLESGENIKTVQELLGHKGVSTTMIYLHAMEGGTTSVESPLDRLTDSPAHHTGDTATASRRTGAA